MQRLGGSSCNLAEAQRPELALMGSTNAIKPLSRHKKSPWRNKSTPLGPQGLHPAGALARTHRGLEYEIPSRQELSRAKSRQNLRRVPSLLPRLGATVGYRKKGYPKQEPKILLKPCKNQSRKTTARSQQILRFARGLAPRPQAKGQKLPTLPRPSRRGPTPKGLGRDAHSPIRSRPGSTNKLVTSVPTELL